MALVGTQELKGDATCDVDGPYSADFLKAAKFAAAEKKTIDSANPNDSTLLKSPYVGLQFAAIPEFQAIGIAVGQQIRSVLAGKATVGLDAGNVMS